MAASPPRPLYHPFEGPNLSPPCCAPPLSPMIADHYASAAFDLLRGLRQWGEHPIAGGNMPTRQGASYLTRAPPQPSRAFRRQRGLSPSSEDEDPTYLPVKPADMGPPPPRPPSKRARATVMRGAAVAGQGTVDECTRVRIIPLLANAVSQSVYLIDRDIHVRQADVNILTECVRTSYHRAHNLIEALKGYHYCSAVEAQLSDTEGMFDYLRATDMWKHVVASYAVAASAGARYAWMDYLNGPDYIDRRTAFFAAHHRQPPSYSASELATDLANLSAEIKNVLLSALRDNQNAGCSVPQSERPTTSMTYSLQPLLTTLQREASSASPIDGDHGMPPTLSNSAVGSRQMAPASRAGASQASNVEGSMLSTGAGSARPAMSNRNEPQDRANRRAAKWAKLEACLANPASTAEERVAALSAAVCGQHLKKGCTSKGGPGACPRTHKTEAELRQLGFTALEVNTFVDHVTRADRG